MRIALTLTGYALFAALMAGLLVVSVLGLREFVVLGWFTVAFVAFRAAVRRDRGRIFWLGLIVQFSVAWALVSLAAAAPVKTRDGLLSQRVVLPKAVMSLQELREFSELGGWGNGSVPLAVMYPESQAGREVRWTSREMTLREFIAGVERQTPLRHRFGSCGNGYTILWGEDCSFGVRLEVPRERN